MSPKFDSTAGLEESARIPARTEPDTNQEYHELTENYLASIAVSLKRLADILEAKAAAPAPAPLASPFPVTIPNPLPITILAPPVTTP